MTSTQGVKLACAVIENNPEKAAPFLILLEAVFIARGDPMGEVMVRDVKRYLFSQTENCDEAIERFISEAVSGSSHLAA